MNISLTTINNKYLNYLLQLNNFKCIYFYIVNKCYQRTTNDSIGVIHIFKSNNNVYQLVGINTTVNYLISKWKLFNTIPLFRLY